MESDTQKKVLLGMPSGSGMVPLSMVQSLLQLMKPIPCAFATIERTRIDKARNHIAKQALEGRFDYLFFVDDDNPVPPETLKLFIEDDKDIVIAPILTRNPDEHGRHQLCAFYKQERDVDGKKMILYQNITDFKDGGPLHSIDAGGCGAMLIKRRVLEAMYNKYRDFMFEFGNLNMGKERRTTSEDVEFCERAINLGFELWLDDRVQPTHISGSKAVQWKLK